ncbi:hypothetical protein, partial [Vibrio parahaemolyticus]|uniref:hypothetical protein n=1 Tax=Vibrio parahaemolyticus TaxID=670 RepID=UPI0027E5A4E4
KKNRFLKQKIQPQKKPENDFHKPERFKIKVRNATKNTLINSKHSALAAFSSLATNAQLRGEARNTDVTA